MIGTGSHYKDGGDVIVTFQWLRTEMRENHCSIEVQVMSCVRAEDKAISSYGDGRYKQGDSQGKALAQVLKEEAVLVDGDPETRETDVSISNVMCFRGKGFHQ